MFHFLYLPSDALLIVTFCVIISFFFEVKAQEYFVSLNYMFLDKKTLLKIWLYPGLNLTNFRGTGPRSLSVIFKSNEVCGFLSCSPGYFRVSHFQTEAECKTSLVKMSFICSEN